MGRDQISLDDVELDEDVPLIQLRAEQDGERRRMTHRDPPAERATTRAPIFVLGISGRSGTNYLRDVIALHPNCAKARTPIWEDFFLHEAEPLFQYARNVRAHWRRWDVEGVGAELLPSLGSGLLAFLSEGVDGRLVVKTPSVRNLDRFFDLFPTAYLVIIVRDPRSVAYSASASFDADYEGWARDWAKGAVTIAAFEERHLADGARYRIVRYEDLVQDGHAAIEDLLHFLDLPTEEYDFEAADALPPRGSSELADDGDMHWEPTEVSASFQPLRRWEAWPVRKVHRVEWIAAPHMKRFGYVDSSVPDSALVHRVRDLLLVARLGARRLWRSLRHR